MPHQAPPRRFVPALLAAVLLLAFIAPLHAQERGNIVGQVRMAGGGQPDERVLITLQGRGIIINTTYCDNEGRFIFYDLLPNPYHVIIEMNGYEPVHEIVNLNPTTSQNAFVRLILRPVQQQIVETPPRTASGGNPYLVSRGDYAKQFPREAIKEFEAGVRSDEHGDARQAMRHYQRAIELASDFYPARNNLGAKYLSRGDYKAAEKEFTEVIRLNPNDAQAYFNLGNALYLTKHYSEAATTLQEGLKRQPDSALGHYLLGSVRARQGAFDEAERALKQSLELDPRMSKVLLELVNLYLQRQRKAEAIAELKEFVRLYPHDPMLPKVQEVLKRLEAPHSTAP